MNKDNFIKYMQDPASLSHASIAELSQLTQEFPYCQSARILLTINLFKEKNIHYNTELKTTAIFAGDRYVLKKHIDRLNVSNEKIVLPDEFVVSSKQAEKGKAEEKEAVQKTETPKEEVKEAVQEKHTKQEKAEPEDAATRIARLRRIVEERIKEIEAEAKGEPIAPVTDPSGKTKQQLIDEFIIKAPGISRANEAFFNPVLAAKESIVDQENIVSETLAQIYFDQQHFEKAIHVYEKLSLKFPEKSTYFAGLIEKAKKELKT